MPWKDDDALVTCFIVLRCLDTNQRMYYIMSSWTPIPSQYPLPVVALFPHLCVTFPPLTTGSGVVYTRLVVWSCFWPSRNREAFSESSPRAKSRLWTSSPSSTGCCCSGQTGGTPTRCSRPTPPGQRWWGRGGGSAGVRGGGTAGVRGGGIAWGRVTFLKWFSHNALLLRSMFFLSIPLTGMPSQCGISTQKSGPRLKRNT